MPAPGRTLFPCSQSYSCTPEPVVQGVVQKREFYKGRGDYKHYLLLLHSYGLCIEMIDDMAYAGETLS